MSTSKNFSLFSFSKHAVLMFAFGAVTAACSGGGGGAAGPSQADAKQSVINQVASIEDQLKDYGVSFEVSKSYSSEPAYSQTRYTETQISVQLKNTRPSPEDLKFIGKKEEDRDKLFVQMNDLWPIVKSNNLEYIQEDAIMTALLKIKIVRAQYMLPKLLKAYQEVLVMTYKPEGVGIQQDDENQLHLWAQPTEKMTNAEASKSVADKLKTRQKFEDLKITFLKDYIEQLERTDRLVKNSSRKGYIDSLREIDGLVYMNAEMEKQMSDLKAALDKLPPAETFDGQKLEESNQKMLNAKRATMVNTLAKLVDKGMADLEMQFTSANGKIAIDEKSKVLSKIHGIYNGRPEVSGVLQGVKERYMSFVNTYGPRSQAPANEAEVLAKAELLIRL